MEGHRPGTDLMALLNLLKALAIEKVLGMISVNEDYISTLGAEVDDLSTLNKVFHLI